jgi:hypothetical protein
MPAMATSPPAPRRSTSWAALLTWVLAIGITAAGLRNALAPEPLLEGQARDLACGGSGLPISAESLVGPADTSAASSKGAAGKPPASAPTGKLPGATPSAKPPAAPVAAPCRLQITRWESGPIGRTFEFQEAGLSRPVRVQCLREYYAVGDYRCAVAP